MIMTSAREPLRWYDRAFNWIYQVPASPPADPGLIGIVWDGLPLNPGDQPNGLLAIVENVEGWCDGPAADGHDTALAVADGSAWGPKTLNARTIVISGAAAGPRPLLAGLRDQLAMRAANRQPADLSITNANGDGRTLTASTRADADALSVTWLGPTAYRYQATLTAADPLLYEDAWQQAVLYPGGPSGSGREYQRLYAWSYQGIDTPNSVMVTNGGNAPAPVWALFEGDLTAPELRDQAGNTITLADVGAGMRLVVETDNLSAWTEGGATRAYYVQPGSVPLLIPPQSSVRWYLYSAGSGQVTLAWRSAWT